MPLRYLADFDSESLKIQSYDVIIIGSGIAGLYTAINLNCNLRIGIISKEQMGENNSYLAQGGIAAAISKDDMPKFHLEDTIKAGAGHCDLEAVSVLVNEAAIDIDNLCRIGTNFDRDPDGSLTTTREGGHGKFRVVHALGDATGREVVDSLLRECERQSNIDIIENCFAIDLLLDNNKCLGILALLNTDEQEILIYKAKKIVCASGGIGQVYKSTTNSEVITGDGIAMAYRAGAVLSDMEFVQFHPTAFYDPNSKGSRFLISEALRGEGAILRNKSGKAFMKNYHQLAEIAPRDIVSRAIFSEMKKTDSDFVYLDITHKDSEYLRNRFPTIYNKCLNVGINITKDYIPVAPVQHYFMGGIKTDLWGQTNIEGFYACGEAANTGVHGANRLASNSLLEGLVFGRRCAMHINTSISDSESEMLHISSSTNRDKQVENVHELKLEIQALMNKYAGIERNKKDMNHARDRIIQITKVLEETELNTVSEMEALNIAYIAVLILSNALARIESIGSHFRTDIS